MQPSFEQTIQERLDPYLRGEIPLGDFTSWFVPATWDIEQTGDERLRDLSNEIYLRLAEYANGHWTEAELKNRLRPLITTAAVTR